MTPTVTIGCPVRNRAWNMKAYLLSLERTIYPQESIGFCFLVNDSTDETLEMLRDWKSKKEQNYKFIDIKEVNLGAIPDERTAATRREIYHHLADVRNRLLDMVQRRDTDYFFSVDSDILIQHNTLAKLVGEDKDVCAALVHNDRNINRKWPNRFVNIMVASNGQYKHYKDYPINDTFEVDVTGAVYLISKSVYNTIRYEWHKQGEDIGFCENAKRAGFKIYCNSELYCYHLMNQQKSQGGCRND